MRAVYLLFFYILYPVFTLIYWIRPINPERIPDGPALICPNHSSYLDIIFLSLAFGRRHFLRYVAKKELVRIPVFGWLLKKSGTIFIGRGESDIAAIKEIMTALKKGYKLVIFPEGTRMKDESATAKTGTIMIASKTAVPVLPVNIPRKKKPFKKNFVVIGEPYKIERIRRGAENYSIYAEELMEKINSLQS